MPAWRNFFLFCRVEKGLKKATGSGRGICFAKEGGRECSFAKTYRIVFFFKRPNYERRARFCDASCKRLACSSSNLVSKATKMIWPLDHGACWMRLFVRIVLIRDRSRHGFDHARWAKNSIQLERPPLRSLWQALFEGYRNAKTFTDNDYLYKISCSWSTSRVECRKRRNPVIFKLSSSLSSSFYAPFGKVFRMYNLPHPLLNTRKLVWSAWWDGRIWESEKLKDKQENFGWELYHKKI